MFNHFQLEGQKRMIFYFNKEFHRLRCKLPSVDYFNNKRNTTVFTWGQIRGSLALDDNREPFVDPDTFIY